MNFTENYICANHALMINSLPEYIRKTNSPWGSTLDKILFKLSDTQSLASLAI